MLSRIIGPPLVVALVISIQSTPAAAELPLPPKAALKADTAVKYGRLDNGLRYAIMRNATPEKGVSIRLAINVGSYEEAENEQGIAHFVEHMAFRSTRRAPKGILGNSLASFGVALGRDQNASTSLRATTYKVDFPGNAPAGIAAALDWMRDAADGMLFSPSAVELERGVVLAEAEARANPLVELQRKTVDFQVPGLRSANREPIGTIASVKSITPKMLQSFYKRWYRPEHATLVIVGDVSVEAVEAAARQAFATWSAEGPPPPRAIDAREFGRRGLAGMTMSDAASPWTLTSCRVSEPISAPAGSLDRLRREIYSELWTTILNQRLTRLATKSGGATLGASAIVANDLPDAKAACLVSMPINGRWQEALRDTQAELRRFAAAGPTDLELEQTVEALRSKRRGAIAQSTTRSSTTIANELAAAAVTGRPYQHPRDAMRTFNIAVDGVTAEDVKSAFEADWRGDGPLLTATAPSAPPEEELLAAWKASQDAPSLEAYEEMAASTWPYSDFGTAGKVLSRKQFNDPEFVRVHFENGVVLNFKQTKFEERGTEIRIRFGHGQSGLTPATVGPATLGATLLPHGGLGKLDFLQIGSIFANNTWSFNLDMHPRAFVLRASPLDTRVEDQLNLLAAYMTDPGFRPLIDDRMPTALDMIYRISDTDPVSMVSQAWDKAVFPAQPALPPREEVERWNSKDFERILRPILTQSPVEVTIVGDLTEAEAIAAVANTFGALPRRQPIARPDTQPFRRFPEVLPTKVAATHSGAAEKAAAALVWPLYVARPERRSEEYAINLVAAIFDVKLRQRIRGDLGKTYSPSVATFMPDYADQGYLAANIEAAAADVDRLVQIAQETAAQLAGGQINQSDVDTARKPMIAERLQALSSNSAWAGFISASTGDPRSFDELLRYEEMMEAVSVEEVQRAAKTWLTRTPIVATARVRPQGETR